MGQLQQLRVADRGDREGEVEEVGLVPDLPCADRKRARNRRLVLDDAGRALGPEGAARPVALDRRAHEVEPGAACPAGDRQRRRLSRQPARRAVEEGENLKPAARRHGHGLIDPAPLVAAVARRLHSVPRHRQPHTADPPGAHVLDVSIAQRRLRRDAEETPRQRLGAGRHDRQQGDERQRDCQRPLRRSLRACDDPRWRRAPA